MFIEYPNIRRLLQITPLVFMTNLQILSNMFQKVGKTAHVSRSKVEQLSLEQTVMLFYKETFHIYDKK